MTRPTDTATSISLSASALADLYPDGVSGDEGLNQLGTMTGKTFEFESGIVAAVLARCRGAGARDVDNVLMGEVVGKLAEWVLE